MPRTWTQWHFRWAQCPQWRRRKYRPPACPQCGGLLGGGVNDKKDAKQGYRLTTAHLYTSFIGPFFLHKQEMGINTCPSPHHYKRDPAFLQSQLHQSALSWARQRYLIVKLPVNLASEDKLGHTFKVISHSTPQPPPIADPPTRSYWWGPSTRMMETPLPTEQRIKG